MWLRAVSGSCPGSSEVSFSQEVDLERLRIIARVEDVSPHVLSSVEVGVENLLKIVTDALDCNFNSVDGCSSSVQPD